MKEIKEKVIVIIFVMIKEINDNSRDWVFLVDIKDIEELARCWH